MTDILPFEEILSRLVSVLEQAGIPYALIGGLAVSAWGTPRATEDIDMLAAVAPTIDLDTSLRSAGFEPEWRRGEPDDPVPLFLRLTRGPGQPGVDVIAATRDWEREILDRAVRIPVTETLTVSVVTAGDLIILKLLAGGPQDLADVANLLRYVGSLADLRQRAADRGVLELLDRVRASCGL